MSIFNQDIPIDHVKSFRNNRSNPNAHPGIRKSANKSLKSSQTLISSNSDVADFSILKKVSDPQDNERGIRSFIKNILDNLGMTLKGLFSDSMGIKKGGLITGKKIADNDPLVQSLIMRIKYSRMKTSTKQRMVVMVKTMFKKIEDPKLRQKLAHMINSLISFKEMQDKNNKNDHHIIDELIKRLDEQEGNDNSLTSLSDSSPEHLDLSDLSSYPVENPT